MDNCEKQKEAVKGLFKERKKREIQEKTDNTLSGFLQAQNIAIETTQKYIEVLEENCKLMEEKNAGVEENKMHKKLCYM